MFQVVRNKQFESGSGNMKGRKTKMMCLGHLGRLLSQAIMDVGRIGIPDGREHFRVNYQW